MFQFPGKLSAIVAPLFAVALMFGLVACGDDESAGPEIGADVEDVREDDNGLGEGDDVGDVGLDFDEDEAFTEFQDDALLGQQVTVSAEVAEIFAPSIFSIAGEGGDEPVLVIVESPALVADLPTDNTVVQVTGTVAEMIEIASFTDFDTEFGDEFDFGFEAEDEAFFETEDLDQFEGNHFLIASEVAILDPAEDGAEEE